MFVSLFVGESIVAVSLLFVFDLLYNHPSSTKFFWGLDFRGWCRKSVDVYFPSFSTSMLQALHKPVVALFGEENASMEQVREGEWLSEEGKKLFIGRTKNQWIGAVYDCWHCVLITICGNEP